MQYALLYSWKHEQLLHILTEINTNFKDIG